MNRPIKFRAWDTVRKEWLFGYELSGLGGFSLTGEVVLLGEIGSIPLADWNHIALMQFTGLLDKNGKEIYEGDIGHLNIEDIGWVNCVCIWNETGWAWKKINPIQATRANPSPYWSLSVGAFEIIGNTYENPELTNRPLIS